MTAVLDELYAQREERDSLDERIKTAEWESAKQAEERKRRESAARVNYEESIVGYREEQDALLLAAQALITQQDALRLRRDRIEAAFRVASSLDVVTEMKPPRIAMRINAREPGIDHYLVQKLKSIALGDL
jgi:hypothetical protein